MTQSLVESANAILAGEKVETFHEMALNEEVNLFIEELNENQLVEIQVLEELGEQWELTEEEYVEAIRCIYEAEREGGLLGFAKRNLTKSGRMQKKIDKANKSAAKSQASIDLKGKLKDAEAKARAARKADTGDERTGGEKVKDKVKSVGSKIGGAVKNFVFGKKKPAENKPAENKPAEKPAQASGEKPKLTAHDGGKKDTPPPASGGKTSKLDVKPKSKLGPIDTSKTKDKLEKRKTARAAGADIKTQKLEQFRKQWEQTGIQDSHDISVYYDVLAGKTTK